MEKNEIKKVLYKEKPTAKFQFIRKGIAYYNALTSEAGIINFEIPVGDMGDADFLPKMDAKLLNRWIVGDAVKASAPIKITSEDYEAIFNYLYYDEERNEEPKMTDEDFNKLTDKMVKAYANKKEVFDEVLKNGNRDDNYAYVKSGGLVKAYMEHLDRYQTYKVENICDWILELGFESYEENKIAYSFFGKELTMEQYEKLDSRFTPSLEEFHEFIDDTIRLKVCEIQLDW